MTANSATPGMSRRKREGREMDGFWGSTIASAMTSFPKRARIESRKTKIVRDKYVRQFPSFNNCARTLPRNLWQQPKADQNGRQERQKNRPSVERQLRLCFYLDVGLIGHILLLW